MAASAASRKRKAQADARHDPRPAKAAPVRPPHPEAPSPEPASLQAVTSAEELEITVDTLRALSAHPGLIKARPCRDLRVAVYEFRQACTTGTNAAGTNLTARITAALADGKYVDARVLLAEMRVRGDVPKVGALCRWVRDLDMVSGLSTLPPGGPVAGAVERSAEEKERLLVVDAILRAIGPVDTNPDALRHPTTAAATGTTAPAIHVQAPWDLGAAAAAQQQQRHDVYASVLDRSILARAPRTPLTVLETTAGPLRKPPNHHPAVLYTSPPHAVRLAPTAPTIVYHAHPAVPGLGVATGVLSPDECKAIVAAGESVGFLPDAPVRPDGADASILAHNVYWVVDTAFHDALWARIAPFVPPTVDGRRRTARGINRRFRVYRYVPGAEYRCHIDGAWPPSGIREAPQQQPPLAPPQQQYVYDASPEGAKQSSLYTFLVYLNDEFEGGETTFFLPGAQEGTLNAYPVRPVMGAVAMFPHGETRGALLHEGTGVRKGAKYVIRTEVEYDVEPSDGP